MLFRSTGFVIADEDINPMDDEADDSIDESEPARPRQGADYHAEPRPENFTVEELERTLAALIEKEDYEEAARISEILQRKKGE